MSSSETSYNHPQISEEASLKDQQKKDDKLRDMQTEDKSSLISPIVVTGLYRLYEFLFVMVSGLIIFYLYNPVVNSQIVSIYMGDILVAGLMALISFQAFNLYSLQAFTSPLIQLPKLAFALTTIFAFLIAASFFFKFGASLSRFWVASWYLTCLTGLITSRFILVPIIQRWSKQGRLNRRAVIVGGGRHGINVIKSLREMPNSDIRICGVFDERSDDRVPKIIEGYPKLGDYDELVDFGRKSRIDLLIVTLPLTAENRILSVLNKLWVLPVDIRLAAHTSKLRFRPRAYSYIGNVPFIDIFDKPIADWDFVLKWIFDKSIALLSFVALLPVFFVTALAVKLTSKGPVFFKQKRYGFNNELIEVYKFRSMYTDMSDADAKKLVTKDDPRVTPVGRFIRKTSIDELPQLFNVLKGELSLVGPRPHALQAKAADQNYHEVVDGYFARHRVKPGITGWAQINGWRGETDTEEKIQKRVEYDLFYIENWSMLFDLYILFKTPFSLVFHKENAY